MNGKAGTRLWVFKSIILVTVLHFLCALEGENLFYWVLSHKWKNIIIL